MLVLKTDSCSELFEALVGRDVQNIHFPGLTWELRGWDHIDGGREEQSMSQSWSLVALLSSG